MTTMECSRKNHEQITRVDENVVCNDKQVIVRAKFFRTINESSDEIAPFSTLGCPCPFGFQITCHEITLWDDRHFVVACVFYSPVSLFLKVFFVCICILSSVLLLKYRYKINKTTRTYNKYMQVPLGRLWLVGWLTFWRCMPVLFAGAFFCLVFLYIFCIVYFL